MLLIHDSVKLLAVGGLALVQADPIPTTVAPAPRADYTVDCVKVSKIFNFCNKIGHLVSPWCRTFLDIPEKTTTREKITPTKSVICPTIPKRRLRY